MSSGLLGREVASRLPRPSPTPELVEPYVLLPREAALLLRVSGRRLAQLASSGMVPARAMPGGSWLFSRRLLLRWLGEDVSMDRLGGRALTTEEAAEFLRRSFRSVLSYVHDPEMALPHARTSAGFRFSTDALLGWVENG